MAEKEMNELDLGKQGVGEDGIPYIILPTMSVDPDTWETGRKTEAGVLVPDAVQEGDKPSAPRLLDIPALMERPFFAVTNKPPRELRRYVSPGDGRFTLSVHAEDPNLGVATLRDAEILMFVIEFLNRRKNSGMELTDVVEVSMRDLLTGIGRGSGGRQYKLLKESLERLRRTLVTTNIGPTGEATGLDSFRFVTSWFCNPTEGLEVRVSDWILQSIKAGALLSLDPGYLKLASGYASGQHRR